MTTRILILLAIFASPLGAQELVLKDGRSVPFKTFKHAGDKLLVPSSLPGGATAEVGYALQTIAEIRAPEPAEIGEAGRLLAANKGTEAMAKVAPVIALYGAVRGIPGQWWSRAALQKAAGSDLGGNAGDAESLYKEIAATQSDSKAAALAELKLLAFQSGKGDPEKVIALLDKMQPKLEEAADSGARAEAALQRANALLAARRFREALEASLSVIVFYPAEGSLHAPATLRAARACLGLDDLVRARLYLEDLKNHYASSPELAAAKDDFARLERREGKKITADP